MGNCCTVESSVDWAGEDWGSVTSRHRRRSSRKVFDDEEGGHHHHHHNHDNDHGLMKFGNMEKERLLGALRASSDANGKVKIMISKKELAKLLGSGSDQKQQQGSNSNHHHASSAEQVLARLIYARDHYDHHDVHHRHWKPVLHSIPEVN